MLCPTVRTLLGTSILACVLLAGCSSPTARMERGDELARQGQYSHALREYQVARRKDPGLFEIDAKIDAMQVAIYLDQGDQAVESRRWRDAERAYGEARRLEPDHPEIEARFGRLALERGNWHFDRGQRALTEGDPTAAIHEFEQALVHRPDHPRAAEALARAERELASRRAKAETIYRQGLSERAEGKLEEALRRFEEALRLDRQHAGAAIELESTAVALVAFWIELGDEAARTQDWPVAVGHFERAHGRNPNAPGLHRRLERARLEVEAAEWIVRADEARDRRDWGHAFECYVKARALTCEPERFQERLEHARENLAQDIFAAAQAAEREGRATDALAGYRRIVEFHPGYRDVRQLCASLASRLEEAEFSYAEGCDACEAGDLLAARDRFAACNEAIPGYLDVMVRLETIRRSVELAEGLYDRACRAQRDGDPRRARVLFEECLALTRPFRDVEERLGAVRSVVFPSIDFVPGYEEGCRAQAERDVVRAVRCFERCETERPGYEDVNGRLQDLRGVVARARACYERASAAEERCDLASAREGFRECLELCSPFEDARERLGAVEEHLRLLRQADRHDHQRELLAARGIYHRIAMRYPCHSVAGRRIVEIDRECGSLDEDYEALEHAERNGQPRLALSIVVRIRERCVGFRDVEHRAVKLELEADYADGCAFEEQGDYVRAVRCFDRALARDPAYRDAKSRAEGCRGKIAPRPGRRNGAGAGPPAAPPGRPEKTSGDEASPTPGMEHEKDESEDSGKPKETGKPKDTGKPKETGKPKDTGKPKETGKPNDDESAGLPGGDASPAPSSTPIAPQ